MYTDTEWPGLVKYENTSSEMSDDPATSAFIFCQKILRQLTASFRALKKHHIE